MIFVILGAVSMLAKPNKTVIEGTVRAIAPASEGQGHEIEIEVHRNLSRGRSDDFIQPSQGQSLHLFAAQTPDVAIGDRVRVQARLLKAGRRYRASLQASSEGTVLRK